MLLDLAPDASFLTILSLPSAQLPFYWFCHPRLCSELLGPVRGIMIGKRKLTGQSRKGFRTKTLRWRRISYIKGCPSRMFDRNISENHHRKHLLLIHHETLRKVTFARDYHELNSQDYHILPFRPLHPPPPSLHSVIMPATWDLWFCGWCRNGPMNVKVHEYCTNCYRRRDTYATYESSNVPPRR